MRLAAILLASVPFLLCAGQGARADVETLVRDLPPSGTYRVEHVVIEYDPAFDQHNRRVQEALADPTDALRAHLQAHRNALPPPWHPDMGVTQERYRYFADPVNHFRIVARTPVRLAVERSGGAVAFAFEGASVRPRTLEIDTVHGAVLTARGTLVVREVVDLDRASMPPGTHQGVLFTTPLPRMRETESRESVLIGRLKGTRTGLLHYSFQDRDGTYRAYVTYPLDR
jgi:hypothetical protein